MSNPYDPNHDPEQPAGSGDQPPPPPPPYGQTPYSSGADASASSPYGQPYGQPAYGQPAYGQPAYGQPAYDSTAPVKNDAVSIIGFILSLTCCLSFVGAIMGGIGLGRTKNNQRKGRWAAISALVIGILGTVAFAAIIVVGVFFANSVIPVDEAEVGQCANILTEDDESVTLTDADCASAHDAEIVYTGTYGEVESSAFVPSNPDDLTDAGISFGICTELMAANGQQADLDALGEDVTYQFVTQTADPPSDEAFYCYVERSDGQAFAEKRLP